MHACLSAAELLSKLSGERTRWGQQLAGLDAALAQLPRDVLLAAALITYLTPHPEDVRAAVLGDWRK
jgi:dynein heavy chain 2